MTNDQFDHNWTIKDSNNTPNIRLRWYKEQTDACINAGFNVTSSTDNHLLMEQMMK